MDSLGGDVAALKAEVERLNRELAQTSAEKIQSAQYGLVLLVSGHVLTTCLTLCSRAGREGGAAAQV